jgi:hypothetical protein
MGGRCGGIVESHTDRISPPTFKVSFDDARCILVLWSNASVASPFVRDEATEGLNGRLVPLLLDVVKQPLGFRQLHAANLSDWAGDASHGEFVRLLESIGAIVAPRAEPTAHHRRATERDAIRQFEVDAYISYSHFDDLRFGGNNEGWVTTFARALEIRLTQLLGRQARVDFDSELHDHDIFSFSSFDSLGRAAVMVAIVSPRYVKSAWTTRELQEFLKVAKQRGDVHAQDSTPIFKVLKTPVPLDRQPAELKSLLGYEFVKTDPVTGKASEFDHQVFGPPPARRDYWVLLDNLAHDIAAVLEKRDGGTT